MCGKEIKRSCHVSGNTGSGNFIDERSEKKIRERSLLGGLVNHIYSTSCYNLSMENKFKTMITFGVASIILFYTAFSLKGMLGWVTPTIIIQMLSSEHMRRQILAVFQTLSQPILICLSVGFLLVAFGILRKNFLILVSLWTALSVALAFIIGKIFIPIMALVIFAWLLGPLVAISILILILGFIKSALTTEESSPSTSSVSNEINPGVAQQ